MGMSIKDLSGAFREAAEKQIGAASNRSAVKARRGVPNKWEAAFAREVLEPMRISGQIHGYRFEAMKLQAGFGSWYTGDWAVSVMVPGIFDTIYEVKGLRRAAGIVKIKAAAQINDGYKFILVTGKAGGGWEYSTIGGVP